MKRLLVIGGTGFLGSAVVRELARRDTGAAYSFTLPTRRRERAKHLLVLPTAHVIEADVHDPATLARLMTGQGEFHPILADRIHIPPQPTWRQIKVTWLSRKYSLPGRAG